MALVSSLLPSQAWEISPENPNHHHRPSYPSHLIRRLGHERGLQHLSRNVPPGGRRVRGSLRARIADYRGATSAPSNDCWGSRTSRHALDLPDVRRPLVAARLRPALRPGTRYQSIAWPSTSGEMQAVYRLSRALLTGGPEAARQVHSVGNHTSLTPAIC